MVTPQEEGVEVAWQKEMVDKAEPKVGTQRYRWRVTTVVLLVHRALLSFV